MQEGNRQNSRIEPNEQILDLNFAIAPVCETLRLEDCHCGKVGCVAYYCLVNVKQQGFLGGGGGNFCILFLVTLCSCMITGGSTRGSQANVETFALLLTSRGFLHRVQTQRSTNTKSLPHQSIRGMDNMSFVKVARRIMIQYLLITDS